MSTKILNLQGCVVCVVIFYTFFVLIHFIFHHINDQKYQETT